MVDLRCSGCEPGTDTERGSSGRCKVSKQLMVVKKTSVPEMGSSGSMDVIMPGSSWLSLLLRRLWIVLIILIFGFDQGIGAIDDVDGTERGYPGRYLAKERKPIYVAYGNDDGDLLNHISDEDYCLVDRVLVDTLKGDRELMPLRRFFKGDEKEHTEDGDKQKDIEEMTVQTNVSRGKIVILMLSAALHSAQKEGSVNARPSTFYDQRPMRFHIRLGYELGKCGVHTYELEHDRKSEGQGEAPIAGVSLPDQRAGVEGAAPCPKT
uniref:Uncharacterized protein n=1 Tax=Tanacetum cinerariifolium TaxID=118510 RepID=A0A6L2P9R1_TANCI|nr:hypothetical protein [Tanacetum cinerariifolium]